MNRSPNFFQLFFMANRLNHVVSQSKLFQQVYPVLLIGFSVVSTKPLRVWNKRYVVVGHNVQSVFVGLKSFKKKLWWGVPKVPIEPKSCKKICVKDLHQLWSGVSGLLKSQLPKRNVVQLPFRYRTFKLFKIQPRPLRVVTPVRLFG